MTLDTLKNLFRWLGILQFESQPNRMLFAKILSCICCVLFALYVLTTFWFFTFDAVTFQDYSRSFFFFLTASLSTVWYVIYLMGKDEYVNLFDDLDDIIEKRKRWNLKTKAFYHNTNERVEKFIQISHDLAMPFCLVILCSPILRSFWKYYSSGHSNDSFELLIPASFPFDSKTPSGFLASALFEIAAGGLASELFYDTIALTGGFCFYTMEFVADLIEILHDLNQDLEIGENRKFTNAESIEIRRKFIGIKRFHSEIIEFCNRFADLNSATVFSYLLYAIVSFGSLFLSLNMLLESGDLVGTIIFLGPANIVVFWLYFFCIFGDNATNCLLDVRHDMYDVAWHLLPLNLKKQFPMMVALSQKEVYVRGFGRANCTRELFVQIMKSTLSYFMMMRKLTI